jgi:signal transduction histidine kinase
MPHRARLLLGLAFLAVVVAISPNVAADATPFKLSPALRSAWLGTSAEVLEDPTGELSIEAVTSGPASVRFVPLLTPTRGYRRSAFWVRFSVRRDAAAPAGWVIRLTMTPYRAELYEDAGDGYRARVSGTSLPFGARDVDDPHIAFRIEPPAGRALTYYLRLEFDDTSWLEPEVYSDDEYARRLSQERFVDGLYYGAILALIGYNALLFLVTRDRAALMYVVFELALVLSLASADRIAFEYLWPNAPMWAGRSQAVFGCAAIFGALGFARSFLALRAAAPRLARVYRGLMAWALAGLTLTAASALRPLHALFVPLLPPLVALLGIYFCVCLATLLGTGFLLARRGIPGASFYLAAWILLCGGVLFWIFCSTGVLPILVNPIWVKAGSFAEATLLSLGLGIRVRGLREAEERARARLSGARDERLAALGRLVAGFAHEIGNPLNFVLGGGAEAAAHLEAAESQLARGDRANGLLAEELGAARQAVRLVVDGTERMKRILDNLRCFVRGREVEPVVTDLVAGVRSTLALAAPLLERSHTRVALESAPGATVFARPGEIEQVMMNLLVNACQAMAPDGGEVAITVSVADDRVTVAVEDSGPGIPQSEREAVFEPFFTTKAGREGMGLGLYMSIDLVRRNGGELRVEGGSHEAGSKDGPRKGARFVMSLPRST